MLSLGYNKYKLSNQLYNLYILYSIIESSNVEIYISYVYDNASPYHCSPPLSLCISSQRKFIIGKMYFS